MTQEDAMNMNNKQAIQILTPFCDMLRDQNGCPISDAYFAMKKAIEALKAERWIPCSERLPVINEEVLVYMYDVPYIAWLDSNGEWNTETFTLREEEEAPTGWLPLPSPYKGEVEIEVKKNDK